MGSTAFWGKGTARAMIAAPTTQTQPERVDAFVSAFRSFDRAAATATVRTVLTRSPGLAAVLPLARLAPDATIEVVPECGHLAPLEALEAVVAALNFLARRTVDRADGLAFGGEPPEDTTHRRSGS